MMQRQFHLARSIFRNHRFKRDALYVSQTPQFLEKRGIVLNVTQAEHIDKVGRVHLARRWCKAQLATRSAHRIDQIIFDLARNHRRQVDLGKAIKHPL